MFTLKVIEIRNLFLKKKFFLLKIEEIIGSHVNKLGRRSIGKRDGKVFY